MQDYSSFNETCCSVYSDEYMSSSGYTYYETRQQRRRAKNELGRSMVEMLGVLAVIGVLSVAGVAGFKTAMDKHRANELMNEASKRAIIAVAQLAQGKTADQISLAEFTNNTISGATFATSTSAVPNSNKFAIGVSGVEKSICKNLVNMAGNKVQIAKQADLTTPINASQCEDSNTLAFLFESDENFGSGTSSDLSSNSSLDSGSSSSEEGYYYCDNSGYGSYIMKDGSYIGTCGYPRVCRGGGYFYSLGSAMEYMCTGSFLNSEEGYYACVDSSVSPFIERDGSYVGTCGYGRVCRGGWWYHTLSSAMDELCYSSLDSGSSLDSSSEGGYGYYYCAESNFASDIVKDGSFVGNCGTGVYCMGRSGWYYSLDSALENLCSSLDSHTYQCTSDGYILRDGYNTGYKCESEGYSYCDGSGIFFSVNSALENLCH